MVPTCLRTPVLILDPPECMRRYHKPELQGAFPTKFPIEGFGPVQPRNDLRRSIIPPNFRELPERVAAAMTTLIQEDILAADAADAEYHAPLRGLPPLLSSSQVTSSTSPRRNRRPSEGAESTNTESARYMDDLNIEETRCSAVRDTLHCSGHSCMRCPAALRDRNPLAGEVRVDAVDTSTHTPKCVDGRCLHSRTDVPPLGDPFCTALDVPTGRTCPFLACWSGQSVRTTTRCQPSEQTGPGSVGTLSQRSQNTVRRPGRRLPKRMRE